MSPLSLLKDQFHYFLSPFFFRHFSPSGKPVRQTYRLDLKLMLLRFYISKYFSALLVRFSIVLTVKSTQFKFSSGVNFDGMCDRVYFHIYVISIKSVWQMDFSLSFSLKRSSVISLSSLFCITDYASKVEMSALIAQLMCPFYFIYELSIVCPTDFWFKKQVL